MVKRLFEMLWVGTTSGPLGGLESRVNRPEFKDLLSGAFYQLLIFSESLFAVSEDTAESRQVVGDVPKPTNLDNKRGPNWYCALCVAARVYQSESNGLLVHTSAWNIEFRPVSSWRLAALAARLLCRIYRGRATICLLFSSRPPKSRTSYP